MIALFPDHFLLSFLVELDVDFSNFLVQCAKLSLEPLVLCLERFRCDKNIAVRYTVLRKHLLLLLYLLMVQLLMIVVLFLL